MPDPTPAPLTDEQLHALQTAQIRGLYVDALCEAGDDYNEARQSFDRWYAAVVAKAKREAAEEIAQAIERKRAGDRAVDARITGPTPEYRVGHADGLTDAAVIARGIGATR